MSSWKKSLLILFHPIECFDIIKRERKFRFSPVVLLPLLAIIINFFGIFIIHFPFSTKRADEANILLEAAMIFVPILSWAIAAYAMTAILSGETHFGDFLTASVFCLTPYILIKPLLLVLSNFLGNESLGIFAFLQTALIVWVGILMFLALKKMNDYSFFQAVGVVLISLIAVIIMWAIILLLFSLTLQLAYFFINIFNEFKYKVN